MLALRHLRMARGRGFRYGESQGDFRAGISMNPLTARAIYCAGLCFLTACAVLPEPPPAAARVAAAQTPGIAEQLAAATRDRIEAGQRYGSKHPKVIKAAATEAMLRSYAQSLAAQGDVHSQVLKALSNELAAAMALRAEAAARYGARHPEMLKAEALVRDLTIALNAEVRSHS